MNNFLQLKRDIEQTLKNSTEPSSETTTTTEASKLPKAETESVKMKKMEKDKGNEKDEEGKTEINIITQRSIASQAISKALDGIKDDEIKKSLESDALAFLMNPEAETVGENLARYMYGKGVKFVK